MCVGLYQEQEVLKEEVIRRKREVEKLSQQVRVCAHVLSFVTCCHPPQLTDMEVQKLTCSQDLGDCNMQVYCINIHGTQTSE